MLPAAFPRRATVPVSQADRDRPEGGAVEPAGVGEPAQSVGRVLALGRRARVPYAGAASPRRRYFCAALRSKPVCRVMALIDRSCRYKSRITTIILSVTT